MEVDVPHYCAKEADNQFDSNAIAVFGDPQLTNKISYLKREDAAILQTVFQFIQGKFYLKAKISASKFS